MVIKMAQYFKTKEFKVDTKFMDYFYLNDIKNYNELYIINEEDYDKVFNLENTIIFGNDVNDNNPIYTNLLILNNTKNIYLKENLDLLNDKSIKDFILGFRGTIICNSKLVNYLNDINLIKEVYKLNQNKYLKIDKLGNIEELNINN